MRGPGGVYLERGKRDADKLEHAGYGGHAIWHGLEYLAGKRGRLYGDSRAAVGLYLRHGERDDPEFAFFCVSERWRRQQRRRYGPIDYCDSEG